MKKFLAPLLSVTTLLFSSYQDVTLSCTQRTCTNAEIAEELYSQAQFVQEQIAKVTGLNVHDPHYSTFIQDYIRIFEYKIKKIRALAENPQSTPKLLQLSNQLIRAIHSAIENMNYYQRPNVMKGLLANNVAEIAAIAEKIRFA